MCGIAGFWSLDKRLACDKDILERMADQLHHRGPDGRGFYTNTQKGLGMAHTRLAIIDLETGEQPIVDKHLNLVITANGEFYDYKRIRGHLVTEGHRFLTKSDSEIALKLYQKHGLDFVKYLRGEFAFALYDEKKDELILVRDRFGIRPLFFHAGKNMFAYASEIKSLLANEEIPRKLSQKALLHQLMQVMVPGQTLFEDIYSLKAGHMLIVNVRNNGFNIKEKKYWDATFPEENHHAEHPDEEAIRLVREKLIESVSLRLEADVPVACYLSGGIDSCAILGMASAIQQSPVKGFTISFDDVRYDEAGIAKEMAHSCGAEQDILTVRAGDLYGENFEQAIWHSERTFYNTLCVAKMLMSRHVTQNGYKVVITGEGSDEIFGGYAAFKRDMFLHGGAGQVSDMEGKLKASNQIFSGSILAESEITHPAFEDLIGFTPSWIQPWLLTLKKVRSFLSNDFLEQLGGYDPVIAIVDSFDPKMLRGRHALDQSQYTWIKTMLEGQILSWGGDRVDMANSLESRPAFLDHHVVELAIQLPPEQRIRNGVEKWILREAMKNILPDTLYRREKFAFMAPPAHTDQKKELAIQALLQKHVSNENVDRLKLLDRQKWTEFLTDYSNPAEHAIKTRSDIILNHVIQLHALTSMFMKL